jgi:hypothetical protein
MKHRIMILAAITVWSGANAGQSLKSPTIPDLQHAESLVRHPVEIIDIRALALRQVEEERLLDEHKRRLTMEIAHTATMAESDFGAIVARHLSDVHARFTLGGVVIQSAPLVIATFLSLAGTLLVMHKVLRRGVRRHPPIRYAPAMLSQEENIDALLAQAELIRREKSRAAESRKAEERASGKDDSAATARKLGIAQGELEFVRQFGAVARRTEWEKKLELLEGERTSPDTLALAKKLGVGKGELDLAAALRRVHHTQPAWEPLS